MIIGIGGSSNSGKSQLAKELVSYYGKDKAIHLCQDDFVFPTDTISKINGHTDWEQAETINIESYLKHIEEANKKFEYVFSEGIFAFHFPELNKLYSTKFYLEIDKKIFFNRKKLDSRWGIEPNWYIQHIWNSHLNNSKYKDLSNTTFINANNKAKLTDILDVLENKTIEKIIV